MPKGIKLNNAMNELINKPKTNTNPIELFKTRANKRKNKAKAIFVSGPASEVLPIVFLSATPLTKTAPGEIILKGDTIDSKVIRAPHIVTRNSAHNP